MLAPYRDVLAIPGAWKFAVAAWVGRISLTMIELSIVLLVASMSGSYGRAGAVAATFGVAMAVGAAQLGRLVDRFGQSRMLPPLIAVHTCGLVAVVACAGFGAPEWTLFVGAAVAGVAMPMTGAMARARWVNLLGGTPRLDTAFSLESVLSEMGFLLGPFLATTLATQAHPAFAMGVALTCTVGGASALAIQRGTEPPIRHDGHTRGQSALHSRGLIILVTIFFFLGTLFGSLELSVVAFSEHHGALGASGAVLGIQALGSLLAGVAYGTRSWQWPLHRRFLLALVGLVAGLLPLLLAPGMPLLIVGAFIGGAAISPTMIPAFALVERLVPATALTEGFTWMSTSVAIGVAAGTSAAGQVVDAFSPRGGLLVSCGAGVAALVVAVSGIRQLRTGPPAHARTEN